jgi:hypothetical protein
LREKNAEVEPRISPDGRWMAYSCGESGQMEIYLCKKLAIPSNVEERFQQLIAKISGPLSKGDAK